MPTSGRSFAANVKKANISSAPEKNISVCFSNMPLVHNQWSKGSNVQIKHFPSPVLSFENMLSQITPGINDDQRIGDQLYVSRMKARLFFTAGASNPALTYRVVVYMTPNSLPTSTGEPTLLDSNVDAMRGYNHLLRSVDKRSNHVLFQKLISPNQMGGLVGTTTSYVEEISVRINKTITYQPTTSFVRAHKLRPSVSWTITESQLVSCCNCEWLLNTIAFNSVKC